MTKIPPGFLHRLIFCYFCPCSHLPLQFVDGCTHKKKGKKLTNVPQSVFSVGSVLPEAYKTQLRTCIQTKSFLFIAY